MPSSYSVGVFATDFDQTAVATEQIPPGFDEMTPGPVLGAFLSGVDVDALSGYDRVVVLRAHQRMASHYQARMYTDMARISAEAAPDLTTGQLRARIKKLCIQTDTEEAQKRYERAVDARRVIAEPTVDGTAHLQGSDLPPDRVAPVTRRINSIARSLCGNGETRTMDQLRADVYLDLLERKQPQDSFQRCRAPHRRPRHPHRTHRTPRRLERVHTSHLRHCKTNRHGPARH